MNNPTKTFLMLLSFLSLNFASCDKDSPKGELDSGRANISFTSNPAFEGSSSFSINNTNSTSTSLELLGSARNIKLMASEKENNMGRTITLDIILSGTANTTNGNIKVDLSKISGGLPLGKIVLKNNLSLLGSPTYTSNAGTLTITKLSSAEIQGTFDGSFVDNFGNTTFNVSNGQFAGKF